MAKIVWKKEVFNQLFSEQQAALVAAGFQIEGYIKKSMTSTKGGGKLHIPSAPGQPPAVDTGRLRASISTNWSQSGLNRGATDSVGGASSTVDGVGNPGGTKFGFGSTGQFKVVVGTNVEYGPPLCFGSVRMAPRPFIRPAFDLFKNKIAKMVANKGI